MVSIRQILCPVDFSEFSKHAFDRALAVARPHGARVTALHVVPVPSGMAAVPFGPEGPGQFALQAVDREQMLRELRRFVAMDRPAGAAVDVEVMESTTVHREILVQAQRLAADLIVMGTHGRSGFDRLLLGSVTEKVLRRARVPVLTVPSHMSAPATAADGPFLRIVCAVDFSAPALNALRYADSLAGESGASIALVHAVELLPVVYEPSMATPFDPGKYWPALERAAQERLHGVAGSLRRASSVEEVVSSGKPYVEILKAAADRRADLIVLGIHGHNVLDRMLFGSTAEHVVRRATCPVLTVREAGAED